MYIKTKGLVLRDAPYKESSRILTVLTDTEGKITVNARGAKRKGSKNAGAAQLLGFSELTLFHERGRYTLTESHPIELFEGLREDVALLSLGVYFAELMEAVSDEDIPNPEILSLGLNALYALSEGKNNSALVKAAFELRLSCLAGFEPSLYGCSVCGREESESPLFDLEGGVLTCRACAEGTLSERMTLSPSVLRAMQYIVGAEAKRLYSFTVSEKTLSELSRVAEAYLLTQLGTEFRSLDFYKSVR
ncbi:MAG: DNA repair protein RecO [Oscillospiraceae bacterium]|nr:DNA repair protein RecO [Oscillospiraceae bacterium]